MSLNQEQFGQIKDLLPVQRGNVEIENHTFLRAVLYIVQNGCKWRALPAEYGKWNSVYQRAQRWAKNGVFQRLFTAMQEKRMMSVDIRILCLDSTSFKVHPDAHGALKKTAASPSASPEAAGTPSFIWYPQMTRLASRKASRAASATTRRRDAPSSRRSTKSGTKAQAS
jgi:transposase